MDNESQPTQLAVRAANAFLINGATPERVSVLSPYNTSFRKLAANCLDNCQHYEQDSPGVEATGGGHDG